MTVHTDDAVRGWIGRVLPVMEVWVAELPDRAVVGLIVLDADWVDQLYVEPELPSAPFHVDLPGRRS
jgi:hypothetical protein